MVRIKWLKDNPFGKAGKIDIIKTSTAIDLLEKDFYILEFVI